MDHEYITTDDALAATIDRLQGQAVLGVDTEAAGYHRYHDRISLIQISSPDENFLIDPIAISDLGGLGEVFGDGGSEKIFHDADFDLRILDRDLDLHIDGLFDTQIAASFAGASGLGLGAVVDEFLGVKLPKAYQRADWAERPLSEGMRTYAVKDTAYLPPLREVLIERLEKMGRMHWAREEFKLREATRWTEPDSPEDAFLRIKGARDLSPRGLAILREIYQWREKVGEERDTATFRILSNKPMLEIALRAPENRRKLESIKGISTGLVGHRGDEMLAAVRRGQEVPDGELPSYPVSQRWERDTQVEEATDRMRRERNRLASGLGLDPGFLIARAVLEDVAKEMPANAHELRAVPDVRDWQVEAVGDELLAALHR